MGVVDVVVGVVGKRKQAGRGEAQEGLCFGRGRGRGGGWMVNGGWSEWLDVTSAGGQGARVRLDVDNANGAWTIAPPPPGPDVVRVHTAHSGWREVG